MKKILILALVLAPAVVSAQSENANVVVSTTIQGAFALTPQNLAFGNVQENTAVTITRADVKTNAGDGSTRGQVAITGTTGEVIYTVAGTHLNATNGTTLTIPKSSGTGNTDNLVVTLTYGQGTGTPVDYTPGTATAGAGDAERSLVIGGSFTSTAGTAGNTYSSTLTISVIYD